jgi:hypothetical protein
MNCPSCGQVLLTGTRFCSNCGTEIAAEQEGSQVPNARTILESSPPPYLLITAGPGRGQAFDLRGEVHLGRSHTNAITLLDAKVSRTHARLDPIRHTYILTDLGSANGTFVNGVRINQPVRLRDGDMIQAGDVQLVFHTRSSSLPSPPDRAGNYPPHSPLVSPEANIVPGNSVPSTLWPGRLPTWVWAGCAGLLVLIGLLIAIALATGILIGQGLGGG